MPHQHHQQHQHLQHVGFSIMAAGHRQMIILVAPAMMIIAAQARRWSERNAA